MSAAVWPFDSIGGMLSGQQGETLVTLLSPKLMSRIGMPTQILAFMRDTMKEAELKAQPQFVIKPFETLWIPYGWSCMVFGLPSLRIAKPETAAKKKDIKKLEYNALKWLPCFSGRDFATSSTTNCRVAGWLSSSAKKIPAEQTSKEEWLLWRQALQESVAQQEKSAKKITAKVNIKWKVVTRK